MSTKTLAAAFGKGLLSGLLGTLAITLSQTIEAKIRQRPPSDSPAEAAGKVLGVAPTGDAEKKRFSLDYSSPAPLRVASAEAGACPFKARGSAP